MVTYEEIREAGEKVYTLEKRYLTERGWEEKCNFPDHCWRWVKKLEDDRTVCVNTRTAITFQQELDYIAENLAEDEAENEVARSNKEKE